MDEDFGPGSGGVASQLSVFVVPAPSPRTRRNGAPTPLVMAARSRAWTTRRGEASVYASESREARFGRRTGAMAVEQLSLLSSGRSRAGASE